MFKRQNQTQFKSCCFEIDLSVFYDVQDKVRKTSFVKLQQYNSFVFAQEETSLWTEQCQCSLLVANLK